MPDAERTAQASLAVGALVLALKGAAWWLTGSAALFADMLETVVQVAASGAALAAVRYAAIPADENHPYGHEKAEYFSAVLEGALIIVAALLIVQEAWSALASPRAPDQPALGLALSAAATVIMAAWATVLARRGRVLRSPALAADARYLMADVVTSAAVIAGVALVAVTGVLWLDPALAVAAAGMILLSGLRLLRESVGGLMDEAVAPDLLGQVRATVSAAAEGAIEAHDLRTRRAGRQVFVEFHLVVPGEMPVATAHDICDRVETALRELLGPATITIHVEPEGKAKHSGVLVL
jgi:cation diffusion facilitator family transporter